MLRASVNGALSTHSFGSIARLFTGSKSVKKVRIDPKGYFARDLWPRQNKAIDSEDKSSRVAGTIVPFAS